MLLFGGKEIDVFEVIDKYFDVVENVLRVFRELVGVYFDGDFNWVKELEEEVLRFEIEVDGFRRSIELMFYEGVFFLVSRGDYVRFSELID